MVRNYKRKTTDRWTKEDLLEALKCVRDCNLPINEATKKFGMSRATLYRQYQKFILSGGKMDVNQFRTCGGNPILTIVEEDVLEKTILDLREQGFTVCSGDIKRICFEYCDTNSIPNHFRLDKRMASDDWYYGFLKRHPAVRLPHAGGRRARSASSTTNDEETFSTPPLRKASKKPKKAFSTEEKPVSATKSTPQSNSDNPNVAVSEYGSHCSSLPDGNNQNEAVVEAKISAVAMKKPLKRLNPGGNRKMLVQRRQEDSGPPKLERFDAEVCVEVMATEAVNGDTIGDVSIEEVHMREVMDEEVDCEIEVETEVETVEEEKEEEEEDSECCEEDSESEEDDSDGEEVEADDESEEDQDEEEVDADDESEEDQDEEEVDADDESEEDQDEEEVEADDKSGEDQDEEEVEADDKSEEDQDMEAGEEAE